jgi:hypothetical protein
MTEETTNTAKRLAAEHWEWIGGLFNAVLNLVRYLYISSFENGYKEGFKDGVASVSKHKDSAHECTVANCRCGDDSDEIY